MGVSVVRNWLLFQHEESITTAQELREFQRNVGFSNNFRIGRLPSQVLSITLGTILVIPALVMTYIGAEHPLFSYPTLLAAYLSFLILLLGSFRAEKQIVNVLIDMQSSFEDPPEEYFSFAGQMLRRLYEPSPFAANYFDRRLHPGSSILYIGWTLLIVYLVIVSQESPPGAEVVGASEVLLVYLIVGCAAAAFTAYIATWAVLIIGAYMGVYVRSLTPKLDTTRSMENLGFQPYGEWVWEITFLFFIAVGLFAMVVLTLA